MESIAQRLRGAKRVAPLIVVLCWALVQWVRKIRAKFPEPGLRLPLLGHMHMIDIKNLAWELERLRKKVNSKVMGLWLGSDYWVYITSPELTHKVFVENGHSSAGRSAPMPAELARGERGIALNQGPEWVKHRKLLLRELVGSKQRTEVACVVFDELVDRIGAASERGSDATVPAINHMIHSTICDAMCVLIFGQRQSQDRVEEILQHIDYIGKASFDYMMMVRIPFYRWLGLETVSKFESSCHRMLAIVGQILEERKQAVLEARRNNAAVSDDDNLLADHEEHPFLDEILFEALQGGLDTTTAVIEWTIAYVTDNPHVQERLHSELDKVLGDRKPTLQDRHNTPYFNAVILETLRLAQVSSLIIPHKATAPIELQGYGTIPKGATLVYSFNELHGSPELYNKPLEFNPDRFLNEDKAETCSPKTVFNKEDGYRKVIPWAIGPRSCPGYSLAFLELYLCLGRIFQNFSFSSPKPVDLTHYTDSIPVRVKDFVPTVHRRQPKSLSR